MQSSFTGSAVVIRTRAVVAKRQQLNVQANANAAGPKKARVAPPPCPQQPRGSSGGGIWFRREALTAGGSDLIRLAPVWLRRAPPPRARRNSSATRAALRRAPRRRRAPTALPGDRCSLQTDLGLLSQLRTGAAGLGCRQASRRLLASLVSAEAFLVTLFFPCFAGATARRATSTSWALRTARPTSTSTPRSTLRTRGSSTATPTSRASPASLRGLPPWAPFCWAARTLCTPPPPCRKLAWAAHAWGRERYHRHTAL